MEAEQTKFEGKQRKIREERKHSSVAKLSFVSKFLIHYIDWGEGGVSAISEFSSPGKIQRNFHYLVNFWEEKSKISQ